MILFYVGHPAHFHNVKNLVPRLKELGHESIFVVRPKDVLLELITDSGFKSFTLPAKSGNGVIRIIADLLHRVLFLLRLSKKENVKVLVGTDPTITHVARLRGLKSIVLNEDDAEAVPKFAKLTYPFAHQILVPDGCSTGGYEEKTTRYAGFHELAYLSPAYFTPSLEVIRSLNLEERSYVIMRFSSLNAHHDAGVGGIDDAFALKMIDILKDKYQVIITSERPLSPDLESFRQSFSPELMHDVLAFAKMIIGDSQTMAAEAMVLGTPSIRCNDFVGRLSYLEELEKHYQLGYGVLPKDKEDILGIIPQLLANDQLSSDWFERRQRMLSEKIDVVDFWKKQIELMLS